MLLVEDDLQEGAAARISKLRIGGIRIIFIFLYGFPRGRGGICDGGGALLFRGRGGGLCFLRFGFGHVAVVLFGAVLPFGNVADGRGDR